MRFWFDRILRVNNSIKSCLSSSTDHLARLELYCVPNPWVVLNYKVRDLVTNWRHSVLQQGMKHVVIGENRYFSSADAGLIEGYNSDFLGLKEGKRT